MVSTWCCLRDTNSVIYYFFLRSFFFPLCSSIISPVIALPCPRQTILLLATDRCLLPQTYCFTLILYCSTVVVIWCICALSHKFSVDGWTVPSVSVFSAHALRVVSTKGTYCLAVHQTHLFCPRTAEFLSHVRSVLSSFFFLCVGWTTVRPNGCRAGGYGVSREIGVICTRGWLSVCALCVLLTEGDENFLFFLQGGLIALYPRPDVLQYFLYVKKGEDAKQFSD